MAVHHGNNVIRTGTSPGEYCYKLSVQEAAEYLTSLLYRNRAQNNGLSQVIFQPILVYD